MKIPHTKRVWELVNDGREQLSRNGADPIGAAAWIVRDPKGKSPHNAGSGGNGSTELCYLPLDLLALTFWVNADAATDLTAAGVRGLLNSFAAVDATRAEVCSFVGFFVDMIFPLTVRGKWKDGKQVLLIPVGDGSGKKLHLIRM